MNTIKVILADHHPIVREGLRSLFRDQKDIDLIAEADNGDTALELAAKYRPQLLLLEMNMPGYSVRQILRGMQVRALPTTVLIVSNNKEEQYAAQMMQAGARGFINKNRATKEILEAIRKIADGGIYISPELAQRIAMNSFKISSRENSTRDLSVREQEVLVELASGRSVGAIATHLHLSPKTVSTHKSRIFQKLGIRNTFDLVRYTLDQGLLE